MRCLADFRLDSDLCLDSETGPLTLDGPNDSFTLTVSNAEHDPLMLSYVLSAQIVFEAPSFENIRVAALAKLAECLNVLSYATNRKFSYVMLRRIIDWTPGIQDRNTIIYVETPEWDVAEPGLDQKFMDTAKRPLAMSSGEEQQAAMRWYRLAIQASIIEEQFSYFVVCFGNCF
jgi:hypothetical protein